ncbi:pyruvate, phosphate dikinase [Desulfonema ishimotonii]|uniref:Pyruvate, phosphate dikinase n=1 Tax=Desulfonema ishimotonii TaxID=45657 RepID=A0A401FX00_9BACT|nr:pyruvate, phosphate dikinase [Desulfonema ishimotonii]GBC61486.1 pyruvate, phosphate dikinase [Desulfonema ishimotonii]
MWKKWVYLFSEIEKAEKYTGGQWDDVRGFLGGKGSGLADMKRIGIPVPPGFTVTTEACNTFISSGGTFPRGMWDQVREALRKVEKATGKQFGGRENPLLLSCRSGAKFSMPGMMDTVLNIGLNDEVAKGLIQMTGDERFVYDAYRRLVQMFGSVVMGIPDTAFEAVIAATRKKSGATTDAGLGASDWENITEAFLRLYRHRTGGDFPEDPFAQLRLATDAVFKSWNSRRATEYRNAAGIPHTLGTAVNIMAMVFGNMGPDCATGVAMTRSGATGGPGPEGDYLLNAQGEDVVAGIRQTQDITHLRVEMPGVAAELEEIARRLESHYRDMQDLEFTVERGKLRILQTRDGKRTAMAAVRIAVDMADEGLISREEAVLRVTPDQIDFFFHPQFEKKTRTTAREAGRLLATGLNVSPGAACGMVAFDADLAEVWGKKQGKPVIMVRPETRPDDVHGMLAARGILTSRGGRTSHAALVARQFGKPAVVGAADLKIDIGRREMTAGHLVIREGDWLSVDGTVGEVYRGELETVVPNLEDPWLMKLLSWADQFRRLRVRTNADYPGDAERAREYGAEGIGLCRTEHMFFEPRRLPLLHKMIMTDLPVERKEALDALLPFQREDFEGLFRAMNGKPVVCRLIDPPLHEFLPDHVALMNELSALKIRLKNAATLEELDNLITEINSRQKILKRLESLTESNPMLGMRGVRLGILIPELTVMQVRAIFEAACNVTREGGEVYPEVMIPLTSHVNELRVQREMLEDEARRVTEARGVRIGYKFGTMIETPRAALTADEMASCAEFFSFGTNDLTQMTFGISRDDAETGFLIRYLRAGILPENPFATLDQGGVGQLMDIAIRKGRSVRPDLECGICGEHGGDPASILLCHRLGLTYVSCSPFRVPVARLVAAHAALREKRSE